MEWTWASQSNHADKQGSGIILSNQENSLFSRFVSNNEDFSPESKERYIRLFQQRPDLARARIVLRDGTQQNQHPQRPQQEHINVVYPLHISVWRFHSTALRLIQVICNAYPPASRFCWGEHNQSPLGIACFVGAPLETVQFLHRTQALVPGPEPSLLHDETMFVGPLMASVLSLSMNREVVQYLAQEEPSMICRRSNHAHVHPISPLEYLWSTSQDLPLLESLFGTLVEDEDARSSETFLLGSVRVRHEGVLAGAQRGRLLATFLDKTAKKAAQILCNNWSEDGMVGFLNAMAENQTIYRLCLLVPEELVDVVAVATALSTMIRGTTSLKMLQLSFGLHPRYEEEPHALLNAVSGTLVDEGYNVPVLALDNGMFDRNNAVGKLIQFSCEHVWFRQATFTEIGLMNVIQALKSSRYLRLFGLVECDLPTSVVGEICKAIGIASSSKKLSHVVWTLTASTVPTNLETWAGITHLRFLFSDKEKDEGMNANTVASFYSDIVSLLDSSCNVSQLYFEGQPCSLSQEQVATLHHKVALNRIGRSKLRQSDATTLVLIDLLEGAKREVGEDASCHNQTDTPASHPESLLLDLLLEKPSSWSTRCHRRRPRRRRQLSSYSLARMGA